jgi:hypothetical protein
MKERPILFNGAMVSALLAGTKTQTRRVVKPQPVQSEHGFDWPAHITKGPLYKWRDQMEFVDALSERCPYGQHGDLLWVRESGWERPERTPKMMREGADTWPRFAYAADDWNDQDRADFKAWGFKPRPSIHMPRWASRITLEIVSVRVERLQDINRGAAMAEGCPFPNMAKGRDPREWYFQLWESINGPGSWASNPWVWVVEFKRV